MSDRLRVAATMGTRPEVVKMAGVVSPCGGGQAGPRIVGHIGEWIQARRHL